jgi:hypothetical protein
LTARIRRNIKKNSRLRSDMNALELRFIATALPRVPEVRSGYSQTPFDDFNAGRELPDSKSPFADL